MTSWNERAIALMQHATYQGDEAQRQLAAEREGRARAEAQALRATDKSQAAEVGSPLHAKLWKHTMQSFGGPWFKLSVERV